MSLSDKFDGHRVNDLGMSKWSPFPHPVLVDPVKNKEYSIVNTETNEKNSMYLKSPQITVYSVKVKPEEAWVTITDWKRSQEYWVAHTNALQKEIATLRSEFDKSIDSIMYEMGEQSES